MKPGAGKGKGNQFERGIAKELGKVLYNDEDALWRTHGSGGWKKEKVGRVHPGDIYPIKPVHFPFVVECKDVSKGPGKWSLDDFFHHKKKNVILKWWNKLLDDRFLAGKDYKNYVPLLIITKNYFSIIAITNMMTLTPPEYAVFHFNTIDSLLVLPFETLLLEFAKNKQLNS